MSGFGVAAYDIAALDRIPRIRTLLPADGLALDVGVGTGFTTDRTLTGRPAVCVDVHEPNLRSYLSHRPDARCVVADAVALPFRDGSFRAVLCSEVLEHLPDDRSAVAEIARVLGHGGAAVVTVPYSGLGYTSLLAIMRIKTVHDYPGPEQHVRPGYDEVSLRELLGRHGLEMDRLEFVLRAVTRVVVDVVSLAHLVYQRAIHGRRAWTWADAQGAEQGLAFRVYRALFPVLWTLSRLDRFLERRRGFGIVARAVKR